jgi:hypothetical protein
VEIHHSGLLADKERYKALPIKVFQPWRKYGLRGRREDKCFTFSPKKSMREEEALEMMMEPVKTNLRGRRGRRGRLCEDSSRKTPNFA